MEPIRIEKKGKEYTIIHKCIKCGHEKPNKAAKEDNFEMIAQIASERYFKE
jgi:rRNA maturation protein Nop10